MEMWADILGELLTGVVEGTRATVLGGCLATVFAGGGVLRGTGAMSARAVVLQTKVAEEVAVAVVGMLEVSDGVVGTVVVEEPGVVVGTLEVAAGLSTVTPAVGRLKVATAAVAVGTLIALDGT